METDASLVIIASVAVGALLHLYRYGVTYVLVMTLVALAYLILQARARARGTAWPARANAEPFEAEPPRVAPPSTPDRYTRVDERVKPLLTGLRFVRRFGKGYFQEIADITERFMRIYYNVLVGRFDARTNLDLLRDMYDRMRELRDQVPLTVPSFSNRMYRFGDDNLQTVAYAHFRPLLRIMRGKIKRVVEKVRKKTELI